MALVFTILLFGLIFHSNVVSPDGISLGFDFSVFWSASHLALLGHPEDAYQLVKLHSVIHTINPSVKEGSYGWFYPPNYFLIIAPLAYIPYLVSYLLFISLTLFAYLFVVHRIYANPEGLWCLAGFSGLWDNLVTGQNGFLTAAIAGGSLLLIDKRPVIAGMLIGILSIKPQLILLFPIALVASKAWKTLIVAILTSALSLAASTMLFGVVTLESWVRSIDLARSLLEFGGTHFWMRVPTIFSFLHLLGIPLQWAYLAHFFVAAMVATSIWITWKSTVEPELRNAALITGSLLISPYILIYDLTWLALPIAWMSKIGIERGWLRWEIETLILAWLLPAMMLLIARFAPFQFAPWVLLALLILILRRTSSYNKQMIAYS
jgi:hypothetical protein